MSFEPCDLGSAFKFFMDWASPIASPCCIFGCRMSRDVAAPVRRKVSTILSAHNSPQRQPSYEPQMMSTPASIRIADPERTGEPSDERFTFELAPPIKSKFLYVRVPTQRFWVCPLA
ncbi:hypothetical protein FA13DRAFT_1730246 [Coprinellus micaceus]|uniref:Uncharacterized protein n=1 Tax=Coprinellus micaceus TaxID=71717 RepID=A0A4Y7TIF1_COPMI|nr:hypothetical protein FA13DRAFT_1730246 [Coprinellus micaceus]